MCEFNCLFDNLGFNTTPYSCFCTGTKLKTSVCLLLSTCLLTKCDCVDIAILICWTICIMNSIIHGMDNGHGLYRASPTPLSFKLALVWCNKYLELISYQDAGFIWSYLFIDDQLKNWSSLSSLGSLVGCLWMTFFQIQSYDMLINP